MRLTTNTLSSLYNLPAGKAGIKQTLLLMRDVTRKAKRNVALRTLAGSLTKHLTAKNWLAEITVLHAYVRDHIRYTRDINGIETIQTPDKTLELGYGDCDDKSTLLATLLEMIGHPARFVAVGFKLGKYSHVYVETLYKGKWIALETTEPVAVGWVAPNIVEKMIVIV